MVKKRKVFQAVPQAVLPRVGVVHHPGLRPTAERPQADAGDQAGPPRPGRREAAGRHAADGRRADAHRSPSAPPTRGPGSTGTSATATTSSANGSRSRQSRQGRQGRQNRSPPGACSRLRRWRNSSPSSAGPQPLPLKTMMAVTGLGSGAPTSVPHFTNLLSLCSMSQPESEFEPR
jgi:hypothetical protein